MRIQSVIFLFAIFFFSSARADYHYVSHDGSNEYPYISWETAANLIQDAVDAAEPGDTIYVGAGVWDQRVRVFDGNVALIGMGIGNTIIENYTEDYSFSIESDTVLVEGFSFIADFRVQPSCAVSGLYWGYMVVKNNYFYGQSAGVSGNLGGHIFNNYFEFTRGALVTTAVAGELIFENNTIFHTWSSISIDIMDLRADTSKLYVRNNLFYMPEQNWNNFDFHFMPTSDSAYIHNNLIFRRIGSGGIGYGSFGCAEDQVLFYNNTIDGRTNGDGELWIRTGIEARSFDSMGSVDNNIVVNCELGVWNQFDNDTVQIRYSNFFDVDENYHGSVEFGEGVIFADPMFVDTLGFRLQAFSPAIDGGDPEILDPDGSRSDIGAYGGPYGESYEYLDLPPGRPDSLRAEVSAGLDTIYLYWLYNTEADLNRYQIHRDTVSGFVPDIFNMIAEPDTSVYIDTDFELSHSYYYRIAAVDNQDNISEYSEQLGVIFTGIDRPFDPNLPRTAVLYQNYPNPFNQSTVVKYYLPDIGYQPAEVRLRIYDVLGRLVRTLVDDRQYPGEYSINWDGLDERRQELPSGVYFYRLFVSKIEFAKPKKLILMR